MSAKAIRASLLAVASATSLDALPTGEILSSHVPDVEELLSDAWDELSGPGGGMRADKLLRRTEQQRWEPPHLTFSIERHGAYNMGSSRAERQSWTINLDDASADFVTKPGRQIDQRDSPLDVKSIAQEIARLVADGLGGPPRIEWKEKNRVVEVHTSEFIKGKNKQTIGARRKRFLDELEAYLASTGWKRRGRSGTPTFERI